MTAEDRLRGAVNNVFPPADENHSIIADLREVLSTLDEMRASYDERGRVIAKLCADLAKLEQGCETCKHNTDGYGDCELTKHVEVSDQGTRFESWTRCETLGNRCGAWEAKRDA
jgi:hypothetical protein